MSMIISAFVSAMWYLLMLWINHITGTYWISFLGSFIVIIILVSFLYKLVWGNHGSPPQRNHNGGKNDNPSSV